MVLKDIDKMNYCTVTGIFNGTNDALMVQKVKGNHTVYFSSSLYIINQKPMIPKTLFHCITTCAARSSG